MGRFCSQKNIFARRGQKYLRNAEGGVPYELYGKFMFILRLQITEIDAVATESPCHSEPVRRLVWESLGKMFSI